MLLAIAAVIGGLIIMVWSADRFVDSAAITARHFGMAPLLIGMVIVGFGTSAPEMAVSALAASQGSPDIALGNAFGSNITNIALILGISALICPIIVHKQVLRKELPILLAITLFTAWLLFDGNLTRLDGFMLLGIFAALMAWTLTRALRTKHSAQPDPDTATTTDKPAIKPALMWLVTGLILLVASSQALVWGAVTIAAEFGVSELLIGLTIVAVGTSLPELASSVIAARKGEHDIALGNVLGSNLFNTLVVVGIAATLQPMTVTAEILSRDIPLMTALTLSLFVLGYSFRRTGRLGRFKGLALTLCYLGYTLYLVTSALPGLSA